VDDKKVPEITVRKVAEKTVARKPKPRSRPDAPAPVEGPLHQLAEKLKSRIGKARPDHVGLCRVTFKTGLKASVSPAMQERAADFAHRFVTMAEEKGHTLQAGDDGLTLLVDGEVLKMELVEKLGKIPHVMTSKEATEKKKWEERNAKRIRDWGLNYYSRPSIPEFDYFPSGDLSFQFTETGYNGLRRTFADGKIQRLETMVERICAAAEKIAAARKADRTAREQREREWAEQARLRKEQEKLQGLEKKRIEDLEKSAKAWRHANQLRAYIEEVRSQVDRCEDPDAAMKWVVWAEAYLEKIDPLEKGLPRLLQLDDFSEWELTSRF
jgi:hypothetical protein